MSGRHGATFTTLALVACFACSRDKNTTGGSAAPSDTASVAVPVAPPPSKPTGPVLTEPAVRELVQKWTAAQSSNDFAGYEALYAERFTGVKRAGTFTKRLGRAEWMADRKTMIAPGLVVEASEVKVEVSPAAANVHFIQRYKSPRFEDVGPKQLIVVLTPTGPRIAREEMLASTIQMQGLGKPLASRLHASESTGVFLVSGLPKEAGKKPFLAKPEYLRVHEADAVADDAALTAEQRAFVGKAFTVYDAAGRACSAVVKTLSVKALVIPHFGVLQSFDDREAYPDPAAAQKAKPGVFYDMAGDEGRYLFGHFESACPGARWAVEGSAIAVVPKSESPKQHPGALATFRALPTYTKMQAEFSSAHPEDKARRWETYDDGQTDFDVFRPEKGAPLVVVSARSGSGCSDFYASMSAFLDASDAAHPVSRGVLETDPSNVLNPLAAVDLDGNGEFELVTGPDGDSDGFALVRPSGKGAYVREQFFSVPYLDCPC